MELSLDHPITKDQNFTICFVCLGNICRSPTAEGFMQHLIEEEGLEEYFEIDSAGTSAYHIGEPADERSQRTANKHGITLHSKGRQFVPADLERADLILTMDNENLNNVRNIAGENSSATIMRMRDFDPDPGNGEVPDPYQGGAEGFELVFQIVKRSCRHLLTTLTPHIEK